MSSTAARSDAFLKVCDIVRDQAARADAESSWPETSMREIAGAGLLRLTVPAEFGGAGAGMREFAEVLSALAAVCGSTAMIYLMHVCGTQVLVAARHEDSLKRIVTQDAIATLAFSEYGSRSHFWAPVSESHANGTGTKIRAEKSFVTSAGKADLYVTSIGSLGRQSPTDSTLYVLDKDLAGFRVTGKWDGLGLRANSSGPMSIECAVDSGMRLSDEGGGFKMMMEVVLPWFQVGSAAVSIGIARVALADAVTHASSARFDHIGDTLAGALPGIRARLARMHLRLEATSAYLDRTLTKIEMQAPDAMLAVLGVKAVAGEAAIDITDEAMRTCGGAAFGRRLSVERHFRDARAASVMAPTTDVLYDFIGKALAGLPLF